jgi:hypothetical protein
LIDFLFLLIPYKMDAGQYMKYKVRAMSTFTSRSGCTESGLRTWALGQAVNQTFVSQNALPAVLPNTMNFANNMNISTQQFGNPLTNMNNLGSTRIGFGGDYVMPIQPTTPLTSCSFLESQSNFYLPPIAQGGFQIPYTIPVPYKYSGNPAPYANPLVYLSTPGVCNIPPFFQGTKQTAALAFGARSENCDNSTRYFPSTIVPGASAY